MVETPLSEVLRHEDENARRAAAERVATLWRQPLPSTSLSEFARCGGEARIAANHERPDLAGTDGLELLERWRQQGFSIERTALAVLAPRPVAESTAKALSELPSWPDGPKHDDTPQQVTPPTASEHGAFVDGALARGTLRVHAALRVNDARHTLAAAHNMMGSPSPLRLRLAMLAEGWHVAAVEAVAHSEGGCLRLTLDGRPEGTATQRATSASEALGVASRVAREQLALPATRDAVLHTVTEATDPRDAARRAAWWTLSRPRPASTPSAMASSLAISAADLPAAPAAADAEVATLRDIYASGATLQRDSFPTGERFPLGVAVEQGQGRLWVMLTDRCLVHEEGLSGAGLTALATLRATETAKGGVAGVTVEPWLGPAGIGLVAHARPLADDHDGDALAERVVRGLTEALTTTNLPAPHFEHAHDDLLRKLQPARHARHNHIAKLVAPNNPSWLIPIGDHGRVASFDEARVANQWRAWLRQPLRLAILANEDRAQAEEVRNALWRWLPHIDATTDPRTCRPMDRPAAARQHDSDQLDGHALIAILLPPDDNTTADAILTLLQREDGPFGALRRMGPVDVDRIVGPLASAVLIALPPNGPPRPDGGRGAGGGGGGGGGGGDTTEKRLDEATRALDAIAESGVAAASWTAFAHRMNERRRKRQLDPRIRLDALSRGSYSGPVSHVGTELERATLNAQLAATLAPTRRFSLRPATPASSP